MTRVIKKYPNRRLYDTETSAYITLAEVKQFVLDSQAFEVRDARTGEDLTRSILLQIILEEESGGIPMFSSEMLVNIIRYYGHAMQGLMGSYLERSIGAFHEAQRKFQEQTKSLYGNVPAFGPDAWNKLIQNSATGTPNLMSDYLEKSAASVMSMQEDLRKQAMQMFSSFPFPVPKETEQSGSGDAETKRSTASDRAKSKPRTRKK